MVEHLTCLSLVESEVERQSSDESSGANEQNQEWVVTVSMGVEWIVSQLVTEWLIVSIWLVHN